MTWHVTRRNEIDVILDVIVVATRRDLDNAIYNTTDHNEV